MQLVPRVTRGHWRLGYAFWDSLRAIVDARPAGMRAAEEGEGVAGAAPAEEAGEIEEGAVQEEEGERTKKFRKKQSPALVGRRTRLCEAAMVPLLSTRVATRRGLGLSGAGIRVASAALSRPKQPL